MALARKYQKIFGKNAVETDLGVVGSKSIDNPQYSTDIETLQSLSNWEAGMRSIITSSSAPYMQDHNALFYVITSQLAYLFQAGIAEWNSQTEYIANRSIVLRNGKTYIAIASSTNVEPEVTSGWESSWKNLLTWGDTSGNIYQQTDLWNLIAKGGLYAECTPNNGVLNIDLPQIPVANATYLPSGTKIRVRFLSGADIKFTLAHLSIQGATGGRVNYKIAYTNLPNQYSKGKFVVGAETIEFTIDTNTGGQTIAGFARCSIVVADTDDLFGYNDRHFRIWRDGWIEQSGTTNSTTAGTDINVNLPYEMYGTNYEIALSAVISDDSAGTTNNRIHSITTTGFKIRTGSTGNYTYMVKGYKK